MAKYEVTCYDPDGNEVEYTVEADDEAAALGHVLDEHGDDIADASPFAVCKKAAPRRRVAGKRKQKARAKPQARARKLPGVRAPGRRRVFALSDEAAEPISDEARKLLATITELPLASEA
jgi:hypothetical protein